jgi:hypothetical protein
MYERREILAPVKSGRPLQLAAWAFAGATLFGSVVSIRNNLQGEPLGIRLPLSIPTALLIGWGAGVAAPWPMPVAALVAATVRRGTSSRMRAATCAGIGFACIAGTLVEPVTRRPGTWTFGIRMAILANMATSLGMIAIGLGSGRRARAESADTV